jgi:hypothetical protein
MGLDPVWLGVMIAINLQTSFLTPPFGFALFYLRGVAPDSGRNFGNVPRRDSIYCYAADSHDIAGYLAPACNMATGFGLRPLKNPVLKNHGLKNLLS